MKRPDTLLEKQEFNPRVFKLGLLAEFPLELFPPLGFIDPSNGKSYTFARPLLCQLWTARRRLEYSELPDRVPQWREALVTEEAYSQAAKDLRTFWKDNGREDFARRITVKSKTIGLEPDATA